MATYMARWGPKGFITAPNIVAPLEAFSTSLTLKTDSEHDTSGTAPTNTRGRELRPISVESIYLASAGVDPRMQVEEWEAELGNAYPFYIGGKRFGPAKMKLTSVSTSDVKLTTHGKWISCKIALTMEEYSEGKTSALTSKAVSGKSASAPTGKKTVASKQAMDAYRVSLEEKTAAMNAAPSASDKGQKKIRKGKLR